MMQQKQFLLSPKINYIQIYDETIVHGKRQKQNLNQIFTTKDKDKDEKKRKKLPVILFSVLTALIILGRFSYNCTSCLFFTKRYRSSGCSRDMELDKACNRTCISWI